MSNIAVLSRSILLHLALALLALLAIAPVGLGHHPLLGAGVLLFGAGIAGFLNYQSRNRIVDWLWLSGPVVAALALTCVAVIVVFRLTVPASATFLDGFASFIARLLADQRDLLHVVAAWLGLTLALCIASLVGAALGRVGRTPQGAGIRYAMHFFRGFAAIFLLSLIFGTAAIVADYGFDLELVPLLRAYGAGALSAFGFQFVVSRLSFVEVSPQGIAGSTFWGRRGFMRWGQMRSVRRYYLFPIPMGLIHVRTSDGSPALWLPTHVKRQRELADALRNAAPADNLLLRSFRPA